MTDIDLCLISGPSFARNLSVHSPLADVVGCRLKQPEHCGDFTEIAKGFWMRRSDMHIEKLADYALKLDVSVVARRLGFMLDVFGIKDPSAIERLQAMATRPYLLLDPIMPNEGSYQSRWKLRVNIDPEEIRSVVRT